MPTHETSSPRELLLKWWPSQVRCSECQLSDLAQTDWSHPTVSFTPSFIVTGSGPHTVSVAERSSSNGVTTLLRRKEFRGTRLQPNRFSKSPALAPALANQRG